MLPPMLRTRFWMPVALPICSLRNVPMASVVKGTKMKLVPRPAMIFAGLNVAPSPFANSTGSTENWKVPDMANPMPTRIFGFTRLTSAPTTNNASESADSRAE